MEKIRPLWRVPGIVLRERSHPAGRARIPEPMVMDDSESVALFHTGGACNPGMRAVYDLGARALDALLPPGGRLLDLGVGSGRALSAVLRRRPDVWATAVDLAPNMPSTARELFDAEGLGERVELLRADITALPERISTRPWDAISCMWTLHQPPDFDSLRGALSQIAAVHRERGGGVHHRGAIERACRSWTARNALRSFGTVALPAGALDVRFGRQTGRCNRHA